MEREFQNKLESVYYKLCDLLDIAENGGGDVFDNPEEEGIVVGHLRAAKDEVEIIK